jgi:TRAP-type C4-dicarboxylate transport system permease small subunit
VEKIVNGYFTLLKFIIVLCLACMVVLVFGNVVLRYAFNSGITVSEELSRVVLRLARVPWRDHRMKEHGHLGMDSLVSRLPVGARSVPRRVQLLMLYATWLFLQGSWAQTIINKDSAAPATGLPLALVYGIGVVFSVSVIPILLYDLYRVLTGKLREDELVMITESEESPSSRTSIARSRHSEEARTAPRPGRLAAVRTMG